MPAEGRVELTASVVPDQPVVAVPVEVEKKGGLPAFVCSHVEFLPELVIAFAQIVFPVEKAAAITDEAGAFPLQLLVQVDEIGIGVCQQVAFIPCVEKNGAGAGEGFYQPPAVAQG
jgi:hypothetical protein